MKGSIIQLLKNWQVILLGAILLGGIVFSISIALPAKYQSSVSLLVVQKQTDEKIDAFSATKSAEYLSRIFSKVIYTSDFFNKLFQSPYNIKNIFPTDKEEWEREWGRTVKVHRVNNTGIMDITVTSYSKQQAEALVNAIAWNFVANGQEYHGGGERVKVSLINGPITPDNPAWPKIWLNTTLGFILGLLISGVLVINFSQNTSTIKKRDKERVFDFANITDQDLVNIK